MEDSKQDTILTPIEEIELYLDLAQENINEAIERSDKLKNNPLLKHMFEPPPPETKS